MNILIESMTLVRHKNLTIRCWREEESEVYSHWNNETEIKEALSNIPATLTNTALMAKYILQAVPRMNAVEVLTEDKQGTVAYAILPNNRARNIYTREKNMILRE